MNNKNSFHNSNDKEVCAKHASFFSCRASGGSFPPSCSKNETLLKSYEYNEFIQK